MLTASNEGIVIEGKNNSEAIDDLHLNLVKGDVTKVKESLKAGVHVDERLKGEWSPLMFASSLGHADIVRCLLEHGSNPNFHKGFFTPLMAACTSTKEECKLLECVKLLVEHGADINAKDQYRLTAVMYASREGHSEIVDYLIEKNADIHSKDNQGRTALFWAISKGRTSVVKVLLNSGALKHMNGLIEPQPATLETVVDKQINGTLHDGNNNKRHSNLSPEFLETLKSLPKRRSKHNEDILKDGLRRIEEMKKWLYQQYEVIYYLRLRCEAIPEHPPSISKMTITRRFASHTREAVTAAECVYNNLKFLHRFALKLSETDEVPPVDFATEKKCDKQKDNWSSFIVTALIVVITLHKSNIFGLLK